MKPVNRAVVLSLIVTAQFFCTSLWFAGNAVLPDLTLIVNLSDHALGNITSAVQFGFIAGTLFYALFTLSDLFSPSRVFFVSALLGAGCNLGIIWADSMEGILAYRLATGFFLAGIYPVGMKIAADHFDKDLGKALGYLVGALVVGTALPHLISDLSGAGSWEWVLVTTSCLALIGGSIILVFVPNGPYQRPGQRVDLGAMFSVFRNRSFRSAAFGYFGHMWELYAFWAFVPVILIHYFNGGPGEAIDPSRWSFITIAVGGIGCVLGGYLALRCNSRFVAGLALSISGICCLISPLLFAFSPEFVLVLLMIWGISVVTDSPQFSTLVARHAPPEKKGTALTIVNCIGFAITIGSIQLLSLMQTVICIQYLFLLLVPGPILGLISLYSGPGKN